jgi:hypothetical protein
MVIANDLTFMSVGVAFLACLSLFFFNFSSISLKNTPRVKFNTFNEEQGVSTNALHKRDSPNIMY